MPIVRGLATLVLLGLAVAPRAEAQIRKCVDERGNVTFTDRPCAPDAKQQEVQVEVTRPATPPPPPPPGSFERAATPAQLTPRERQPSYEEAVACKEMRSNPSEANVRRCASMRGFKTTSNWAQVSDSTDSQEQRVGIYCFRVDKHLDLRSNRDPENTNHQYQVGRFFSDYRGPDFATWTEAADTMCANYAAAIPPPGSRESRIRGAQLVDATCGGRIAEAQQFLAEGVEPRSRSYEHDLTALHCAALVGDVELIRDLVARGANVNDISAEYALQPIHLAAITGQLDAVRALKALGSSIDAPSLAGPPVVIGLATPLGELVPSRARKQLPEKVLHAARRPAAGDGLRRLRAFISMGARLNGVDHKRRGLLHIASEHGEPDVLAELIARKLDVNALDRAGQTPLLALAKHPNYQVKEVQAPMAEALLAAGANVNARDADGWNSFCYALRSPPLVAVLVKYKIDPNVAGKGVGCWGGLGRNMAPSKIIAMADEVPDLRTPRRADGTPGVGPLYIFAYSTDAGLVEYFVKRGLKPVDRTDDGWGVMHAVMKSSGGVNDHEAARRKIAKLVIDAGVDLEQRTSRGETPLMVGYNQTPELIRYVIERGADVNAINPQTGQSVLDIFERFKKTEAVAVLRAAGARNAIGPNGARNR